MKEWNEVYELPLKIWGAGRVHDNKGQFVFQFEVNPIDDSNKHCVEILNGTMELKNDLKIYHKEGYIYVEEIPYILIRGWGNLTGIGGHHFSEEQAAHIQDGFANWIVNKLTFNQQQP